MKPADFEQWLVDAQRTTLLMGILNATPDSFSDGGQFLDSRRAIDHGLRILAEGASIIDIGGESTRPGSVAVDAEEQIRRTVPAIEHLAKVGAVVSIDTTSAAVARRAIEAGATIINDISAGRADPDLFDVAAKSNVAIVLMHMLGSPQTMQTAPTYENVVSDVIEFLKSRAAAAVDSGIKPHRILLDVGIGFGKTIEQNLLLLRHHQIVSRLGFPTVLGTSRKSFIGAITHQTVAAERLMGTAASNAWGMANGADILRVHDVQKMREVVDVIVAIKGAGSTQSDPRT